MKYLLLLDDLNDIVINVLCLENYEMTIQSGYS